MADMTWEQLKATAVPTDAPKPAESPAQANDGKEPENVSSEPKPQVEETKPEAKPEESSVDYSAKLKEYQERLEKAEKTAEKRLKALERISKARAEELEQDEKKEKAIPNVQTLVDKATKERLDALRREESEETIEEVLNELTDNEQERLLVKAVYDNEVTPTGFSRSSISKDLKKAFILANADRFEALAFEKAKQKVRKDMAESKANEMSSAGAGNVGREPPKVDETPVYNDKEQALLSYLNDYNARASVYKPK